MSLSLQHFVSERKYDEDLGKAVKFSHDVEPLKSSIMSFGSGGAVNERWQSRLYNDPACQNYL